jgi:beta-glucuronidase
MGLVFLCCVLVGTTQALLYPQDSETRETKSLDGAWNFRLSPRLDPEVGFREKWFERSLTGGCGEEEVIPMPVPSSYNDITQVNILGKRIHFSMSQ